MQELIQKFRANAEQTTATVELVSNSELSKVLYDQLMGEKNVLVSINDKPILDSISKSINLIQTPTNDNLEDTTVCLTDSICGIAETGSVVIDNDNDYTSYFTMLTKKHIVILNTKNLFEKPRDIFNSFNFSGKSSISIITGPSATADMGSLVRGVHGPEQLHIILIRNDK